MNAGKPAALFKADATAWPRVLLIAKLDRLARNVAFIANLLESGVEVTAADMPEANRFVLHIMAAVAEQECRAISERTRAALAAAKARGVKLGWSIPTRASEQRQAARKGAAANKARALSHAESVLPLVDQLRSGGASLRQTAAELNARDVKTPRGGKWHATTVRNVLNTGSDKAVRPSQSGSSVNKG